MWRRELYRLDRIDMTGAIRGFKKSGSMWPAIGIMCCAVRGSCPYLWPSKGATPDMVEQLSEALEHFAAVIAVSSIWMCARCRGGSLRRSGSGTACLAVRRLAFRYDIIFKYLDIDGLLRESDLVITAEGALDSQTPRGKSPVKSPVEPRRTSSL